jgi:heme A synthase
LKPGRIAANIVGIMLFVQVILGGSAVLLSFPIGYHIVWGVLTFAVLIAATVFVAREYGRRSAILKIALAAIADYVIQGVLGLLAFNSDTVVVVHLTNAFVLAVLATYLISSADRAESVKPSTSMPTTSASPV